MMKEKSPQFRRYRNLFRHVSNPGKYLALKFGLIREDPLKFILKGGLRLHVPRVRLVDFKMIIMDNCYLKGFRPDAFSGMEEMVVVDVGANLGFFSLYMKSRFAGSRIFSIEPLEENFEFLMGNIHRNRQLEDSLIAVNSAIASESGAITLYVPENKGFSSGASISRKNQLDLQLQVPALSLPEFFSRYGLSGVSFLKLDCEGSEYGILYSCSQEDLGRIQNLAIEVHRGTGDQENIESLTRFLVQAGFSCSASSDGNFIWASRDARNLVQRTM